MGHADVAQAGRIGPPSRDERTDQTTLPTPTTIDPPESLAATSGDMVAVSTVHGPAGALVVRVAGEIDLATSARLREELLRLVGRQPSMLVVCLAGVSFVDSTGLSTLVALHRRARVLDVRVHLTSPAPGPWRAFQITGLDREFTIFPTLVDALAG